VTAILTRPIGNQLSPERQMNDIPTASGSHPRDLELQQLALAIKQSPTRTDRAVRHQIERLLTEVSACLQPAKQALIKKWSGIIEIESIVAEAVSNTLMEAVKNLDRYDPAKASVMTWINGILNYRFQDALRKYRSRYDLLSIDNPDEMVEAEIAKLSEPEPETMGSKLRRFIETDPDGHLVAAHLRHHPLASLQTILLMRLDGLKWQEIAERLNISSHSTVNNFHDNQLHKWKDYFRKYLCE
jgi:DNA-directed RNA polymerase specialized sigma24 family protein